MKVNIFACETQEVTYGLSYAVAGATLAYQRTDIDYPAAGSADEDSVHMGASFAVNDDLSVSYGHVESDKQGDADDAEADSFQAAYTMGGATFAIAETKADNIAYAAGDDKDTTTISMSLAF